jgi:hypothetical protein
VKGRRRFGSLSGSGRRKVEKFVRFWRRLEPKGVFPRLAVWFSFGDGGAVGYAIAWLAWRACQ